MVDPPARSAVEVKQGTALRRPDLYRLVQVGRILLDGEDGNVFPVGDIAEGIEIPDRKIDVQTAFPRVAKSAVRRDHRRVFLGRRAKPEKLPRTENIRAFRNARPRFRFVCNYYTGKFRICQEFEGLGCVFCGNVLK